MKQNEQELIAQILNGNAEAYATLIDRYKVGLYRHCFKFMPDEDEAEDVAQEAFIEAFVHLDRFNPEFRFSTWLYKLATNLALMRLRKRRYVRMDEAELDRVLSDLAPTDDRVMRRELREAVDALPAQHRQVITMHYWQGKRYSEIASHLGTSVGSVKGWMSRKVFSKPRTTLTPRLV